MPRVRGLGVRCGPKRRGAEAPCHPNPHQLIATVCVFRRAHHTLTLAPLGDGLDHLTIQESDVPCDFGASTVSQSTGGEWGITAEDRESNARGVRLFAVCVCVIAAGIVVLLALLNAIDRLFGWASEGFWFAGLCRDHSTGGVLSRSGSLFQEAVLRPLWPLAQGVCVVSSAVVLVIFALSMIHSFAL